MKYPDKITEDNVFPGIKPSVTTCGHCGEIHHQHRTVTATKMIGNQTEQEHFCSVDCRQHWQIGQMRLLGM